MAGFGVDGSPCFISLDNSELLGFRGNTPPTQLDDATLRIALRRLELEAIFVCGPLAVVCEHSRVRGVETETSRIRWSIDADDRTFTALGVHDGVALFFSTDPVRRDGGRILGIEASSGRDSLRQRVAREPHAYAPVVTSQGLFYWNTDGNPEIREIDPLSGEDRRRIPLSSKALDFLGLSGQQRRFRVEGIDLQSKLVAIDDVIIIPMTAEDDREASRCVAIDSSGEVQWTWRGPRGNKIDMAARHGSRCVIVTSGVESSLAVLDVHGQTVLERTLGGRASVKNWRRRGAIFPDAPDVLAVAEQASSAPRLTCVSLVAPKPYFSRPVPEARYILQSPQFGTDSMALPIRTAGNRRRQQAVILNISLDNPMRRALPKIPLGAARTFHTPLVLSAHGPWLLVESRDGIAWIGDTESNPQPATDR